MGWAQQISEYLTDTSGVILLCTTGTRKEIQCAPITDNPHAREKQSSICHVGRGRSSARSRNEYEGLRNWRRGDGPRLSCCGEIKRGTEPLTSVFSFSIVNRRVSELVRAAELQRMQRETHVVTGHTPEGPVRVCLAQV